jgi:thioredoxin-like negative regulator of GroEL
MDFMKFFYLTLFLLFTTTNVVVECSISNEELNEDNWRELLENNEWMIEFYAPWCPACNRLQPIWKQFSSKAKELNIKIGAIDLTKYPSLSGLFSVTSLPTIYQYDSILSF